MAHTIPPPSGAADVLYCVDLPDITAKFKTTEEQISAATCRVQYVLQKRPAFLALCSDSSSQVDCLFSKLEMPILRVDGRSSASVLAALCEKATSKNFRVVIVSDNPLLTSLVSDTVVQMKSDNTTLGPSDVEFESGVEPKQLLLYHAVIRCVEGIGSGLASRLVHGATTVEEIINACTSKMMKDVLLSKLDEMRLMHSKLQFAPCEVKVTNELLRNRRTSMDAPSEGRKDPKKSCASTVRANKIDKINFLKVNSVVGVDDSNADNVSFHKETSVIELTQSIAEVLGVSFDASSVVRAIIFTEDPCFGLDLYSLPSSVTQLDYLKRHVEWLDLKLSPLQTDSIARRTWLFLMNRHLKQSTEADDAAMAIAH